jgi:aquaporin TIP
MTPPLLTHRPSPTNHQYIQKKNSAEDGVGRKLLAELVGSALFQIVGGCAAPGLAPVANGIGLAVLAYGVAGISGAHLNPAISLMLWARNKCSLSTACIYSVAQICGCTLGAAMCTLLVPVVTLGMGMGAPGTFAPAAGLAAGAVFAWEAMMTFMLGAVVYSTAVAKPGFGNVAPLAIGLVVTAAASSAGPYTGAILNPARAIGPAIAFGLPMATVAVYVGAQLFGALAAAVWSGAVHQQ